MADTNTNRLVLILSDRCESCRQAEQIWRSACEQHGIQCQMMDMSMQEARGLATKHGLIAFPVVLINDEIRAIGAATREQANGLLESMLAV